MPIHRLLMTRPAPSWSKRWVIPPFSLSVSLPTLAPEWLLPDVRELL
jgi:hypothetical protein